MQSSGLRDLAGKILLWLFVFRLFDVTQCQFFEADESSCEPDRVDYDWEKRNHYEMLGINSKSESKAIRTAYRRQAQQWHPDKIKANATLSIKEINARFARIAEAYETLNDAPKRQAYDQFLTNCENIQKQGYGRQSADYNEQYDNFSNGNKPYYEEYYQQQEYYSNLHRHHHQHQFSYGFSNNYNYYQGQSHGHNHHQQHHSYPSAVQKQRKMLVDSMTGVPIMRETTREEYVDQNYYRILVMDYLIESMDAWGNTFYQPLYSDPEIIEEGQLFPPPSDSLQDGSVLRQGEILLSQNERYRARIEQCQLVIETLVSPKGEDPFVQTLWTSSNAVPRFAQECFVTLEKGKLLIAGGSPESYTGAILWHSTVKEDDNDGSNTFWGGFRPNHVARLENDGKLLVYRDDEDLCVYATGHFGCTRWVSRGMHAFRIAREQVDALVDSLVNATISSKSDSYAWEDDEEKDTTTEIKIHTIRAFKRINNARKRVETSLEEKTLHWVSQMITYWQRYQQRRFSGSWNEA